MSNKIEIGINWVSTNPLYSFGNPSLFGSTPSEVLINYASYLKTLLFDRCHFTMIGPWSNVEIRNVPKVVLPWELDSITKVNNHTKEIFEELFGITEDAGPWLTGVFLGNELVHQQPSLSLDDARRFISDFHKKAIKSIDSHYKAKIFSHRFAGILKQRFGLDGFIKLVSEAIDGVDYLCINNYNNFSWDELVFIREQTKKEIVISEFSFLANSFEEQRLKDYGHKTLGRYSDHVTYPQAIDQIDRAYRYEEYLENAIKADIKMVFWHAMCDLGEKSKKFRDLALSKTYKTYRNFGIIDFHKQKLGMNYEYEEFIRRIGGINRNVSKQI